MKDTIELTANDLSCLVNFAVMLGKRSGNMPDPKDPRPTFKRDVSHVLVTQLDEQRSVMASPSVDNDGVVFTFTTLDKQVSIAVSNEAIEAAYTMYLQLKEPK